LDGLRGQKVGTTVCPLESDKVVIENAVESEKVNIGTRQYT